MSATGWRSVGRVERSRLREARLQAHYAVQWLARAARAYVMMRSDDGHTNLGWDDALGGLTTHELTVGPQLGLRLASLELVLIDAGNRSAMQSLALDGLTDKDVRAWLGQHLSSEGLDPNARDAPSPYEMPPHPIAQGARYTVASLHDELTELANWYANANDLLGARQQALVACGIEAPPVRCWPHHFDLDTLVALETAKPHDYRSVGLGFSPGDEYYDEPYFYVSAYPAPDAAKLPPLPAVGQWHTHEFTAAVAAASRIVAAKDPNGDTEAFLQAAIDYAHKVLA